MHLELARPPAPEASEFSLTRGRDGPARAELIERIKLEIAAGRYETPRRLESALERLLVDVGSGGEGPPPRRDGRGRRRTTAHRGRLRVTAAG
jgi:hypothetical protein